MPPIPTLSDDLISQILVRVQVKSLLRFQSVCKTWLSLIKDPAFVKSHLRHATTTKTDQTLIISHYSKPDEESRILLFHIDSREIEVDLKYLYSRDGFKYVPFSTVVGSANGIVCVVVAFINFKVSIYLWNPATRQAKVIWTFRVVHDEALGFGYDVIDDDYKIVRVVMQPSFSEVYSVKRNVWRKVPDPIDTPLEGDFDVCVNGFLCGIGDYGMMAFDLNKEVLNCGIKLPVISVDNGNDNENDYYDDFGDGIDNGVDYDDFGDNIDNGDDYADFGVIDNGDDYDDDETRITESNARIIEFNKSIGVIILRDTGLNADKKVYMCTLDDEACLRGGGVEASWTLMFSIDLGMRAYITHGYFSNRDLHIILDYADVWISCNVDKREAKIVPLPIGMAKHQYNHHIYKYTESLVSVGRI